MSDWVVVRLWRQARDAFLIDWRAIDGATRSHFLRTLALGLAGALVLTAVVSLVAKAKLEGREMELESAIVLRAAEWPWPSFAKSIWLEEPGGSTMLIPLVLLATWTAARLGRSVDAIAIAASFIGSKPILFLGRVLFDRDRPDLIAGGIARPPTESFPSGHTLQAICFWGVIAYLWMAYSRSAWERMIAVVLFVAVVGTVAAARLRLGTHWPSDLVAGALFGVAWAGVVMRAHHVATRAQRESPAPGRAH